MALPCRHAASAMLACRHAEHFTALRAMPPSLMMFIVIFSFSRRRALQRFRHGAACPPRVD